MSNAIGKALSPHDKRINQCFKKIDDNNKAQIDLQMDKLKTEIRAEMKTDNDEKDNDSRLKNVRINGLTEIKPKEDLKDELRKLSTIMGLDPEVITTDIDVIHRIGKPNIHENHPPRVIIVKSYHVRNHSIYRHSPRQNVVRE